ncbi:MAG: sulfatase-like hydrolase/transferase [Armatimonadetes bacterium]|nr:sulfatase-like hydrolase/transferase [Armatimonadota bacterium]
MKSTTRAWLFAGLVVLLFVAGGAWAQPAYKTKHVFIVVMDGVRWQDTFGDPNHSLIPNLWSRLRPQGCLFTNFYNNGITVTRQGHSTLISGTWQRCANGGARLTMPTLFDYYRDQTGAPAEKCWAIFGKGAYAFAPYSSFPVYADRFAPKFVYGQQGAPFNELSAEGDRGVLEKVLDVMKTDRPDVVFINFGYTDHAGHVAKDIAEYQAAIRNCDECFGKLWDAIQADPYYRDTTTVFFTNDHGRHTDDFHGHGDACEGCRHIMLLILGPDIKKGVTIDTPALQIDVAPTAAELLGIQTPLAQGRVLTECLVEPKNVNRKEAITETAKQAVALFQLASRDMFKAAGDYVAANVDPKQTAADLSGSLLARGMIRAAQETGDARYLDWAIAWIDAHRGGEGAAALSVADAVIDLPAEKRRGYMDWVRTVAGATLGRRNARQVAQDGRRPTVRDRRKSVGHASPVRRGAAAWDARRRD